MNNPPAFPATAFGPSGDMINEPGMTLRDWFAGQAAGGLCAHQYGPPQWDNIARAAYILADAMLAQRENPNG
jgi:hypothetical protein